MSSEYLEWLDDDEHGASVGLKMNAHGYAWLSVYNGQYGEMSVLGVEQYALSPDKKGWAAATMIAESLLEWVRHTKSIAEMNGEDK